jgi:hypothetical protein
MTDNSREHNLEYGLFALAFGLALTIRLLRLGELPLGDDEARWALQALDLAKGLRPAMGPQPAYVVLTGLVFFILQASNFGARLVPALFGAALSLLPYNFRDRLGSKPALILAFFLAVDPGLLALSRLAGSPIMVVTALLFAWGAWRNGNIRLTGIWAGIALLSGPQLWPGLLGLALAYGLLRGFFAAKHQDSSDTSEEIPASEQPQSNRSQLFDRKTWLILVAAAAGTYLVVGSFFLLASGGLSAGLASIPAYFSGWLELSDVSVSRLLIGLFFYEFMALLLAIAGLVRGIINHDELTIKLGLWLLAALVLALIYPAHQMSDLAWMLLPLLILAALEVSRYLVPIQDGNWETIGMMAFTSAILVFAALNYSAIALVPIDQPQLRGWILLGSLGLLVISIAMVAFGWSVSTAVQGGVWGSLLVLVVYTLSTALASAGLRTYRTFEMWPSSPYVGQVNTLVSQMNDLSRWKTGVKATLDVTIAGLDSPSLVWSLRDWPVTISPDASLSGDIPAIVIASDQFASADLQSKYRGQDLTWRTSPLWEQGLLQDWMRWSILHEFPQSDEKIILWVRQDVFIDSQNNP